jgi:hypothetical protein
MVIHLLLPHCCHSLTKREKKTAEALICMASQGRFERPTVPIRGVKLTCAYKGQPEKGGISELASCSALALGFGRSLGIHWLV